MCLGTWNIEKLGRSLGSVAMCVSGVKRVPFQHNLAAISGSLPLKYFLFIFEVCCLFHSQHYLQASSLLGVPMPPWKVSLFTPDNKILLSWGTPAFLRKTRPVLNTCLASFYAPSCSNKKLSTCRALSSFLINVQKGEPFLINVQKGEPFLINIQKGEPFLINVQKGEPGNEAT